MTQAALEWINMLLEKSPSDMGRFIQELLPSLLNALTDSADDVVLMNLQVSKNKIHTWYSSMYDRWTAFTTSTSVVDIEQAKQQNE